MSNSTYKQSVKSLRNHFLQPLLRLTFI